MSQFYYYVKYVAFVVVGGGGTQKFHMTRKAARTSLNAGASPPVHK